MIKSSLSAKARLATVHLPPNPLTDAQWARIEPIIPDWTSRRGGRWRDHHEAISSISRWIHREKYGNWRGVYNRLQMWAVNGTWGRLFTALVAQADADEDLHWVISFDSAVVRAHQHVAGARKTGHQQLSLQDHAIGRSRGGLTPKVHPAPDARCQPQAFVLTAGQAGDAPAFAHIMARLRVPRRRERPRTRPDLVLGRQGVLLPAIREYLRKGGIRAVIPVPADQHGHRLRRGSRGGRPPAFNHEAYKQRNTSNAVSTA